MSAVSPLLVSFGCREALSVLASGVADQLGLAYRSTSSSDELIDLLESSFPAIVVIGQSQIDDACLSLVHGAATCRGVFGRRLSP